MTRHKTEEVLAKVAEALPAVAKAMKTPNVRMRTLPGTPGAAASIKRRRREWDVMMGLREPEGGAGVSV